MQSKKELLEHLETKSKVFKNKKIKSAFESVDRADFVTDDYLVEAYEDYPLPIGHGQTISQPTTVAFMLEKLNPQQGNTVLDIGSGSGWTTALLADMVGSEGEVRGVERVPDLVTFGAQNLSKYNFKYATIQKAEDELGLPEHAPFDRILVSASAVGESAADVLFGQLATGGVLVMPIGDAIVVFEKKEDGVERRHFPGFVFVPLVS